LTTTSRDETEELVAAAEGATLRKTGTGTWHYEAGADINNDGASGCIVIEQGVLDAAGNMGNTGLRLAGGTLLSGSSSSFAGDAGTGSTDEKPFYVGPAGGKLGISPAAAGDVHRGSPITEWDQTGAGTLTLASRADHSLLLDHEAFPDVNAHTTLRIERDEPGSGVVHLGDTTVTVRGTLAGAGTLRLGADATGILRIEGTLTPATDGTPGELAVAGHVVMAPAAALRFDLGPTNASDRFTVGGDLTLDGTVALRRRPGMPDGTNDWILIRYGGALSGPGLRVVPPYGPFAAEVDTSRPGEVRVRVTGAPEPDDDRDGIPNVWEAAHGLNPLSSNEGDSDDDGATDYEEYLADTHPGDPASRLHIESVAMGGGTLTLYFQSSSERVYAVRWWADLSAPESWAQLTNAMRGGGGPVILPCREAPGRAFYRVHARLPD
jgi:hypothetical protein